MGLASTFPPGGGGAKIQMVTVKLHYKKIDLSSFTVCLCTGSRPGTKGHLHAAVLPPCQTGQGALQLQASVRAEEEVKKRIQQSVKAGQTVAQAIDEENGTLQSAWLLGQQQGHKPVSTHEVIGPKDDDEVDCNDYQNAHNLVTLVIGEGGGTLKRQPNVG